MCAESLGLSRPDYFNYLSLSGAYKVDGTDDNKEYQETMVCEYTVDLMILLLFYVVELMRQCNENLYFTIR